MGYPTRRIKMRRHNRNLKLHATVVLCGARVKAVHLANWVGFYGVTENGNTDLFLNPVAAMEAAARVLGIKV